MKTHIDLFSGIGGFALAAEWSGITTIAHSEVEKYACKVYHRHFPASVCLGDITTIDWSKHESPFLLTGGFPCQPHSVAGKRKASADERDLWSECVRALGGLRPRYAIFENVAGLFTSDGGRFFNRILSDVASLGYDAEWRVLSAADVGAPHRRERVWIVAHSPDAGITRREREPGVDAKEGGGGVGEDVPHPEVPRLEGPEPERGARTAGRATESGSRGRRDDWWTLEPNVGRVDHGIPSRVDRLKGLGNAIVPQCAYRIMQDILRHAEQRQ